MALNFHANHQQCMFWVREFSVTPGAQIQLDCHYFDARKKTYKELPATFQSSVEARLFAEELAGEPLHWELGGATYTDTSGTEEFITG